MFIMRQDVSRCKKNITISRLYFLSNEIKKIFIYVIEKTN